MNNLSALAANMQTQKEHSRAMCACNAIVVVLVKQVSMQGEAKGFSCLLNWTEGCCQVVLRNVK